MNEKTKSRIWISILLFLDMVGLVVVALLVGGGGFNLSRGIFLLLLGFPLILALSAAFLLRFSYAKALAIHGALVIGSLVFMFPFAWLVITSFKYPEEVVAYPPKWIPAVPIPMLQSPFVTAELYEPIASPPEMTDERWAEMQLSIEAVLWERAGAIIPDEYRFGLSEESLRLVLVQALWSTLMPGIPANTWGREEQVILDVLRKRVTQERIADVWSSIYRCVAVREPFVTDLERFDYAIAGVTLEQLGKNASHSDNILLRNMPLNMTAAERMVQLAYNLESDSAAHLQFELPLPMASSELHSVTVPLRQDRTWHRLKFILEIDGKRYESQQAHHLSRYRWQELTFKLADRDSSDERDLGIWPLVSVETEGEIYNTPGHIRVTLDLQRSSRLAALWNKYTRNYHAAWIAGGHWEKYIANSVYLVVMNVLGQMISCSMVAYAFSRLRWQGRDLLFFIVLATMMLPAQVTMIPVFLVFRSLGWYNTLKPLWVPAFAGGAFFIFLLRQFMRGIPRELEEAALIDGCGYFGIYYRIILPLIKPALAAVGIFTFMASWNEFMGPLIYISDQRLYPLALGLFNFRSEYGADFGLLMAASTIMILPVVVIFFFAQKYFIQGVTLTGMKN